MSITGATIAAGGDFSSAHSIAPLAATGGMLVSMPAWLPYLRQASETAADLAPLVGVLIGLVTLVKSLQTARPAEAKRRKHKFFATLKTMAVDLARKGGVVALCALGALAVFGLIAHFAKPRGADVTPLAILAAPANVKPRKKSADDAGEDETIDGPAHVDGAPPWYKIGLALRGVHEGTRRKANPVVLAMFADSGSPGVKNDAETPWCAAFVGACLKRAGYPNSQSLMARSYSNYGVACEPRPGCIVVLYRGDKRSGMGHVGFLVSQDANSVTLLGGNQGDAVTVARFAKSKVLAYRWPKEIHTSRTVRAGAVTAITGTVGAAAAGAEVVGQLQDVQQPLQDSGIPSLMRIAAIVGLACALIGVGLGLYTIYRRVKDFNERGF